MQTKINAERVEAIIAHVGVGGFVTTAARSIGVHRHTVEGWIARGDADRIRGVKSLHARLAAGIEEAEAKVESALVSSWLAAGQQDWRAAEAFLSRRWPKRWTVTRKVDERGIEGLGLDLSTASKAELESAVVSFESAVEAVRARIGELDDPDATHARETRH